MKMVEYGEVEYSRGKERILKNPTIWYKEIQNKFIKR